MAFDCRIFGHRGIVPMIKLHDTQFSADSVYQLEQPYEFAQKLNCNGSTPVSSAPVSNPRVTVLRVEVPDGQSVRYEINPPGRSTAAGTNSPILTGRDQFVFRDGWSISLVDASAV